MRFITGGRGSGVRVAPSLDQAMTEVDPSKVTVARRSIRGMPSGLRSMVGRVNHTTARAVTVVAAIAPRPYESRRDSSPPVQGVGRRSVRPAPNNTGTGE